MSYWIVQSYSPWAFATADSLAFEIHSDGVGAGVRGSHGLQGPEDSNTRMRDEGGGVKSSNVYI